MKKIIFAGNWKMYVADESRARTLARSSILAARRSGVAMILFPSALHLAAVAAEVKKGGGKIFCGVQNVSAYQQGAYTGEVSARQARALGAGYALVGHSERRRLCGETDAVVAEKMRQIWGAGMTPIVCVGESAKSTPARAAAFACAQLKRAFAAAGGQKRGCVIAYEPVWAIGGNKNVDAAYAEAVMRSLLSCAHTHGVTVKGMWYGGSVNGKTIIDFLNRRVCTGVLVGSASVDARAVALLCKKISAVGSANEMKRKKITPVARRA
jgi:triosephosphate isomerase